MKINAFILKFDILEQIFLKDSGGFETDHFLTKKEYCKWLRTRQLMNLDFHFLWYNFPECEDSFDTQCHCK